jgi:hypothetical protein
MAEFPTKEDLEKLYREKGHDALVWFAWRNALRALPVLGSLPLAQLWERDTVRQHVYAVCRSCFVLAQWMTAPQKASLYTQISFPPTH